MTFSQQFRKQLLLRPTGKLTMEQTISFLGRDITNKGDHHEISLSKGYTTTMLEEAGMINCKAATTPGTAANKTSNDDNDNIPVDKDEHALYRRIVGKLQWMTYTRPDLSFATKELARSLQQPTYLDMKKMKHTLRYLQGTKDYKFILHPTTIPETKTHQHSTFTSTPTGQAAQQQGKSTTGFAIKYLGATVHFGSKDTSNRSTIKCRIGTIFNRNRSTRITPHSQFLDGDNTDKQTTNSDPHGFKQVAKALQQESDRQRKQSTLI